jgi:hypothetical protein
LSINMERRLVLLAALVSCVFVALFLLGMYFVFTQTCTQIGPNVASGGIFAGIFALGLVCAKMIIAPTIKVKVWLIAMLFALFCAYASLLSFASAGCLGV